MSKWALLVLADKGWTEEGVYTSKEDAEYYLGEYKDELPNCTFKIAKENEDNA